MKKEYRKLSELHNWDKNPRSISEPNFKRLKKQIEKLGEYKPLLITEDGTVLGGNMRLRAYQELKWEKAWVSVVEADTEEEKIEYALSDNDRAGQYEIDQLANLVGNFPEIDWSNYSVDLKSPTLMSDIMDQFKEVEEDEAPAVAEGEPISKLGEVYTLGRHRLMCGDSTKIEDVEKLMDGKKADMVFTDPPYGIEYGRHIPNKKHHQQMIKNDDKSTGWLVNIPRGVPTYVCTRWDILPVIHNELLGLGNIKNVIVWDKKSHGMGDLETVYAPSHEFIVYIAEKSEKLSGKRERDVWSCSRDNGLHPTMKPIEIIAKAINKHISNNVLDLFGGSGSTLIACEQTNRVAFLMELDEKYCDVIRKRYWKFTHDNIEDGWQEGTPVIL